MSHQRTAYEEDDGLGYYPDGVKRTLTDDQIAMFRHSEIYAIIRERQVRKENADADEPDGNTASSVQNSAAAPAGDPSLDEGIKGDSEDEEEYARFLETEQKELKAEAARKNKRNWNHQDGDGYRDRTTSTRRKVREMDGAMTADTVLDYGEDAPSPSLNQLNGRSLVSYYSDTEAPAAVEQKTVLEGRKIWWPTIGGP